MSADKDRHPLSSAADAGLLEERLRADLAPHLLVVRELGAGGMARVFLAREPALKRLVAVKVLAAELSADTDARARFEREAQAVAGLSHPNIVAVYRVGELSDGTPYFVMQHVAGESLHARVARAGPLPVADARRVIAEVAGALSFAHRHKIIHRDIKPANILYEEAAPRALVADFGIAAVSTPQDVRLTQTGAVIGTPKYMSPEQLLAETVSEKTDIYSLGLLAHELLTGSSPFRGNTPNELIAAHLRDAAPRVSERRDDVDPELDAIVSRCLEKDAAKRPSADEISKRLTPGGPGILEWPAPGLEHLLGKARRISTVSCVGSALIAAALTVFVLAVSEDAASNVQVSVLLVVACAVGLALLVDGLRHAVMILTAFVSGRHAGYSRATILETLVDRAGDTGALIAGTGRFAAMTQRQRELVRRRRVIAELLLVGAGFGTLPLVVAILTLGSLGLAGADSIWLASVLPGLAISASFVLRAPEMFRGRQVPPRRTILLASLIVVFAIALAPAARRALGFAAFLAVPVLVLTLWEVWRRARTRSRVRNIDTGVATAWYRSLPTGEPTRGMERPPSAPVWRVAIFVIEGAFLFTALAIAPVLVDSVFGWRSLSTSSWDLLWSRNMLLYAAIANEARFLRIPPDTGITASAAGSALFAIEAVVAAPKPLAEVPEYSPSAIAPSEKGHWPAWSVVARARTVDYYGARFAPSTSEHIEARRFPTVERYAMFGLLEAAKSRVATHLANGRLDSAEMALRENVSFGLALINNGAMPQDVFVGFTIATGARTAIRDFCGAAGHRSTASPSSALCADLRRGSPTTTQSYDALFSKATIDRDELHQLARDPQLSRAFRLQMIRLLALSPCATVREFVFGPGDSVQNEIEATGRAWARFPSETALVDLVIRQPELFASGPTFIPRSATRATAALRLASKVSRNPRVAQCALAFTP